MLKIGPYRISCLETNAFKLDGGAMFGVVPRVMWEKKAPPDPLNRIQMTMNALLVQDERRNILIDTGVGSKWTEKGAKIYDIDPSRHLLIDSLTAAGLKPGDITDVILTHLHFDHTGGSTSYNAEGRAVPTFPNARYYVQKGQWDWAHNPSEKDRASYFPENYDPLQASGQLQLVEGDVELLPHIFAIQINGHSPAQQLIKISDGTRTLLHCGDLLPMSAHVPGPWVMAYDLHPLKTIEEKNRILSQAAAEKWFMFFEHDPYIKLAHIVKGPKGFELGQTFDMQTDIV